METKNGIPAVHAKSNTAWRNWLSKNGGSQRSVWLIIYHKGSKTPSVDYKASIEDALCFGWIDSKAIKRDAESFYLSFTPRKPQSHWSKVNRERVEKLTAKGLMMPTGQAVIDLAKKTGTWDGLAAAQNNEIPEDLQKLFNSNKTAFKNFEAFAPSSKRVILEWITKAKRVETRQQRVLQTVELAKDNIKANHR